MASTTIIMYNSLDCKIYILVGFGDKLLYLTSDNHIIGEKIYLCPIQSSNTPMILAWRNSPHIKSFFLYRDDITTQEHEKWLKNEVSTGKAIQWIIHISVSNQPIGSVYLRDIDTSNKKCQFGIMLGEQNAQGRGYGKEACSIATQYAFEQLNLSKVYLKVVSTNTRALRLYKKVGYEIEGRFRMDKWVDGLPIDVIYMAKFNREL